MPDVSFGPFSSSSPSLPFKTSTYVSKTNMKEKKGNTYYHRAQTMPDASFGPFSSSLPSLPFKKLKDIYTY